MRVGLNGSGLKSEILFKNAPGRFVGASHLLVDNDRVKNDTRYVRGRFSSVYASVEGDAALIDSPRPNVYGSNTKFRFRPALAFYEADGSDGYVNTRERGRDYFPTIVGP